MIRKRIPGAITLCLSLALLGSALSGCTRPAVVHEVEKARAASDEQYRKEMEEIKKVMRGDIKIKLKKDGKGAYSWEITGKDACEVIKANSILSKKISTD